MRKESGFPASGCNNSILQPSWDRFSVPSGQVKRYLQTLESAQSANQINRAHIRLEQRITPLERAALHSGLLSQMSPLERWIGEARPGRSAARRLTQRLNGDNSVKAAAIDWALRWSRMIRLSESRDPEQWRRIVSRLGYALYSRSHPSGNARSVLVAWTGRANFMMLPTADFLQAARWFNGDVLLLRDDQTSAYTRGISGLGGSFEDSLSALSGMLNHHGYENVTVIGGSAGALPALGSASALGARRTVLLGALTPTNWNCPFDWKDFVSDWRSRRNDTQKENTRLFFGELVPRDAEAARAIASDLDVSATGVPKADHGILYPLLKRRQLENWLKANVLN